MVPELKQTNTTTSCKEFYDLMMIEYNKRCELLKKYNTISDKTNVEESDNNFLKLKKKEYESFKDDINKINDLIKKANEIYNNLLIKTQTINYNNKLLVNKNTLLDKVVDNQIKNFEIFIDEKISEFNN